MRESKKQKVLIPILLVILIITGSHLRAQDNWYSKLDAYIEKQMNIPTKRVNPLQNFALPEGLVMTDMTGGMSYALSLGLAMRRVPWL